MSDKDKIDLTPSDELPESKVPSLVIGLAAPVGVDLSSVEDSLNKALLQVHYEYERIKLTDYLCKISPWDKPISTHIDEKYNFLMDAGDEFRQKLQRGDALALLATGAIRGRREEITNDPKKPLSRYAFVVHSLKHPKEVETLKMAYGSSFLLISAYASQKTRLETLAKKIANSRQEKLSEKHQEMARLLIQRDEKEDEDEFGQNIRETFPLADLFVDVTDKDKMDHDLCRFINLLFGYPFYSPTKDEYGMYHAQATALRSASLARQVGAAVANEHGEIIALGCNDVPKAYGGLYWEGDTPDHREFMKDWDYNDATKRMIFKELIERLKIHGWLDPTRNQADSNDLVREAFQKRGSLLQGTQLTNLLEFSPCVHAEMATLSDAARRGVSVQNGTLYVTTFPCHGCAKHLVAAGIKRVVFIEPFPKSRVSDLHDDSIAIGEAGQTNKVHFEPFVGIAPQKYLALFSLRGIRRKDDEGHKWKWDGNRAIYRLADQFPSLEGEGVVWDQFKEKMVETGFWENKTDDDEKKKD